MTHFLCGLSIGILAIAIDRLIRYRRVRRVRGWLEAGRARRAKEALNHMEKRGNFKK